MHSLFVAIGNAARRISESKVRALVANDDCSVSIVSRTEVPVLAQLSVPNRSAPPLLGKSPDDDVHLLLDGYMIRGDGDYVNTIEAMSRLASDMREHGVSAVLDSISGGSFNLVYIDVKNRSVHVANDEVGSIPLYVSYLDDGLIVCNSPTRLAHTGVIATELDLDACASLLRCGYAIGDRHFLRSVRVMPSGSLLSWSDGHAALSKVGLHLRERVPSRRVVTTGELADAVRTSLRRASKLDENIAHLQSAGLDSRLILAAWPDGQDPPCYAYGHPDSTEQQIARQVADVRGSRFTHFRPDGDTVADSIDSLFELNGMIAYADRLLISKKIKDDGYSSVLDGFQGGVLLGGAYYYNDRYFSLISRIARFATIYKDQRISRIGYPAIASTLKNHICGQRLIHEKFPFLSESFAKEMAHRDTHILEDIETECRRLSPVNGSVGTLFRNFFLQNRGLHAITHQAVMCRAHVGVILPYTNDRQLYNLCLSLDPVAAAYRRMYYRMYADHFPEYADIVYGDSMVAARRSPLHHGVYKLLARTEQRLTRTKARIFKATIKPNNWASWFKESSLLREKLLTDLEGSSFVDNNRLKTFYGELEEGTRNGTGDLFHLASVIRWSKIS